MLIQKDYCDYDTCVALKELGYIGQGRHYYDRDKDPNELRHFGVQVLTTRSAEALNFVLAVHLFDAQKWLREEKGTFVYIDVPWKTDDGLGWSYICCNKPLTEEDQEVCFASGGFFDSYEEALLEGIKEAIKILKKK